MRFVIAPDSFKGSLSSNEAGNIIKNALLKEIPNASIHVIPMADGGEGTIESYLFSKKGKYINLEVTGPMNNRVKSFYGISSDEKIAIIEVATIIGLPLVPEENRNPFNLTTYGVGECILHALNKGVRRFIIGLGGSATNDGGIGMLQALGVSFKDIEGEDVSSTASAIFDVKSVDYKNMDPRILDSEIIIASDVQNILCGHEGSSYIFGLQKGLNEEQIERFDKGLYSYAKVIEKHLEKSFINIPGSGAAGGIAFSMLSIGAKLKSGSSVISEASKLEYYLKNADWLITGEGKTDSQTQYGKVPFYLAKLAKEYNVSTILLSGWLEDIEPLYEVFDSMHSISSGPMTLEESISETKVLLYNKVRNIARLLKAAT